MNEPTDVRYWLVLDEVDEPPEDHTPVDAMIKLFVQMILFFV